MTLTRFESPAPPVGVIESLASGFETVAGHLWLVLLPLLLDLLLWVGPRMSARPAFESFYSDVWLPFVEQQPADVRKQFEPSRDQLDSIFEQITPQYLPVVNWPMADLVLLGVPSFVVEQAVAPLPFDYDPPVIELQSLFSALLLVIGLPLVWAMVGVIYRGMVAQEVGEGHLQVGDLLRRLPAYWLNLLAFTLLAAVLALIVMVPFLVVGTVLFAFAAGLASLAVTAGVFVVIWLGLFSSFTAHSVLMNDRWMLRALWDSVRVVQINLSATTLLWALVVGLNLGLGYIFAWAGLTTDMWFVVLAIGVHAFVSTALVAATYVFFKDRYRHWREWRTLLLERLDKINRERAASVPGSDFPHGP